jgi:hypothetical protein
VAGVRRFVVVERGVEMKKMKRSKNGAAELHQARVAAKTLLMPDAMVGVMGGPSKCEARAILKRMGFSVSQIASFEKKGLARKRSAPRKRRRARNKVGYRKRQMRVARKMSKAHRRAGRKLQGFYARGLKRIRRSGRPLRARPPLSAFVDKERDYAAFMAPRRGRRAKVRRKFRPNGR